MGIGAKLTMLGAAGAAGLAAVGAAGVAYSYFFDADNGAQRRKTSIGVVKSFADQLGMGGMDKEIMSTFMNKLAAAK
ncbi:MAG: hypothetical protein ACT4OM_04125 [Actinomycetota bacterium]